MKNNFRYLLIVGLLFSISNSDVLYSVHDNHLYTNEFLSTFEKKLNWNMTVNYWLGYGIIIPMDFSHNNSRGFETAVELRNYFFSDQNQRLFAAFYGGYALLKSPVYHYGQYGGMIEETGISFGLKAGYKFIVIEYLRDETHFRFALEPYTSISRSVVTSGGWDTVIPNIWTLGIRFLLDISNTKGLVSNNGPPGNNK